MTVTDRATPARTATRRYRLWMFGLLYFIQGAAVAYFSNFLKPYLNGYGIDADTIGLLSTLLLLPFILKIFIGILSDRVSLFGRGHRKPYIVLGLLLVMIAFAAAGFITPGQSFFAFAALMVLGSFSITVFDSATDGLAIDVTSREDHGKVQGIMTGGRAFGLIALAVVFGLLAEVSFSLIFIIMALMVLLPLALILPMREPPRRASHQQFDWGAFKALGRPRFLIFAAFYLMNAVAAYGVNGLITYHMDVSFAAPMSTIGTYGTLRGIGAVIGALGAGFLFDRIGRRPSIYGALAAISVFAVLIGVAPTLGIIMGLGLLWGMAWGFMDTVGVALAMDLSDSRIAASMFAIMMALFNVGTAIGEGVATSLTDDIGFSAVFLALAGVNLIGFPLIYALFRAAPDLTRRAAAADPEIAAAD